MFESDVTKKLMNKYDEKQKDKRKTDRSKRYKNIIKDTTKAENYLQIISKMTLVIDNLLEYNYITILLQE